jgi:rhamnogalacturonyl hydrolase YesR
MEWSIHNCLLSHKIAFRDLTGHLPSVDHFDPSAHVQGAVEWILRAWEATPDDGISKGYNLLRGRWEPSYPETSGYTITSLLNYHEQTGESRCHEVALRVADYLCGVQMPEGAIPDWRSLHEGRPTPVVFDTGQVIFGWLRAYEECSDERYRRAALKAADWLVSCQRADGSWRDFQHLGTVKTIDTRVAWALLRADALGSHQQYVKAAQDNLEWALSQQKTNGWFRNCSFERSSLPVTHTIAYTAEGLLESGLLLGEHRYVEVAKRTADALLNAQRNDGSLSSAFDSDWKEASRSSCLTGNCQIARIWLRLYQLTGEDRYLRAAQSAITYVASTQDLETKDQNIRGGIKGSHPIYGAYERYKLPNWAAKFFVDALMLWCMVGEQ